MSSFEDILNKPLDTVEAPPPIPVGLYRCSIAKPAFWREAGTEWKVLVFPTTIIEPANEEVNMADYVDSEGKPLSVKGKPLYKEFMFSLTDEDRQKESLFQVKRFLADHCGMDIEGRGLSEILPSVVGAQCLVQAKMEIDKRDQTIRVKAGNTAAV